METRRRGKISPSGQRRAAASLPSQERTRRRGFSNETIEAIHNAYRLIYQSGLNTTDALNKIEAEMEMTPEIRYIVDFIRSSERGIIPGGK